LRADAKLLSIPPVAYFLLFVGKPIPQANFAQNSRFGSTDSVASRVAMKLFAALGVVLVASKGQIPLINSEYEGNGPKVCYATVGSGTHARNLPSDRRMVASCTIITGKPSEFVQTIHTQMPVILPEEHQEAWLSGESGKEILEPFTANRMKACPNVAGKPV
jgi:hypothetical protein